MRTRAAALGAVALIAAAACARWRFGVWLGAQERRASADSRVAVTDCGPVEYDLRGEGPVVLHVHGGNVGHSGWFTLDYLVEAGFRLLTPDRPGYLGTPLAENGSPQAQADVLVALLNELGIERVVVVGVSAGGPAALQLALRYPDRVDALVLISAITKQSGLSSDQLDSALGRLVMSRHLQEPAYFAINQAMKRLPRLALRDYARTETTYPPERAQLLIRQTLADPRQRAQVSSLADAIVPALPRYDGVRNDLDVQQSLPRIPIEQITAPALIVHSRYDGDAPYDNAQFAHAYIPDAQLITVDQFGHLLWWGDPKVTRRIEHQVTTFLHAHTGTA